MKRSFILILILAIVALVVTQVDAQQRKTIFNQAYANDQADTSGTYFLGGASRISLHTTAQDSFNCITYIDYRPKGSSGSWTTSATYDSVNQLTALDREFVVRNNTTEAAPGVDTEVRFRNAFGATRNTGTATQRYTQVLVWR